MNRQLLDKLKQQNDKYGQEHPEVPVIKVPLPAKLRKDAKSEDSPKVDE